MLKKLEKQPTEFLDIPRIIPKQKRSKDLSLFQNKLICTDIDVC